MASKTHFSLKTPLDMQEDLRTDYALIATGVGAALVALIYLLLI